MPRRCKGAVDRKPCDLEVHASMLGRRLLLLLLGRRLLRRLRLRVRRTLADLDLAVRAREDQALVPVRLPPDEVRRLPVLAADVDDLAVAVGPADVAAVHDHVIALRRLHVRPPVALRFGPYAAGPPGGKHFGRRWSGSPA